MRLIRPDWPAPAAVNAAVTTRLGGVSLGPYRSLNLGSHVGDAPANVAENRLRLRTVLQLPAEPRWLTQVHGTAVLEAGEAKPGATADASWTDRPGVVCAVLTADCLPVLFCDDGGQVVAAAHAGWRGLVGGVLEATVAALPVAPGCLLAWLGPAIGPGAFEVGDEVRAAFMQAAPSDQIFFRPSAEPGKWLADLYGLARRRLRDAGVARCHGGEHCTVGEPETFFSFRRDGVCGRMAALIWLSPTSAPGRAAAASDG